MFDAVARIEVFLRSRLAYFAAKESGAFGYPEGEVLDFVGKVPGLVAEPGDLGTACGAPALDEHEAVSHAQRVAACKRRRAQLGQKTLPNNSCCMFSGMRFHARAASMSVMPRPRRNSSSCISLATNLAIIASSTPSARICCAISSYLSAMEVPFCRRFALLSFVVSRTSLMRCNYTDTSDHKNHR